MRVRSTFQTIVAAMLAVIPITTPLAFKAAPFTTGRIAVLQTDEGDTNTLARIIKLDPTVAGQTPSNIITIPTLRLSGTASSTGHLSDTTP
jgi:hypothetical protein